MQASVSSTHYATRGCLLLPVLAASQGAGGNGNRDSMDDVDEAAIWQEIQKRQKQEAAEAAEGSSRRPAHQPAAAGEAPAAAPDVSTVQQAAAARLPPEPAAGSEGSCRIAFRLPDGSRVQRTFNTSDTVATLQVRTGLEDLAWHTELVIVVLVWAL